MSDENIRSCFVHIDEDLCIGCTECVRVCPTKAMRVKDNKALILPGMCIGCGQCMIVCKSGAITAPTSEIESLKTDKISIALVSPVLYAQFPGVLPKDILLGMKNMGFSHVVDMSYYFEMFQWATTEYISRNRETGESPWPLISPVCPVVLRLIACRFPALLPNVHPIMRPVTFMARDVVQQFSKHYGINADEILLYYINPCPSKMGYPKKIIEDGSRLEKHSTGALGINDIFGELSRQIRKIEKSDKIPFAQAGYEYEQCTTGGGLLWGLSGGEVNATGIDKTLAVAGLKETITYLEKIEMGLFNDLEYIELRTCREGCIGGPLNAIDKYLAKSTSVKMAKTLGVGTRLNRERVLRLYDRNWFFKKSASDVIKKINSEKERKISFEELSKIEKLAKFINGKNCGACGAPDCRTFAEDVITGFSSIDDCIYMKIKGLSTEDILSKLS